MKNKTNLIYIIGLAFILFVFILPLILIIILSFSSGYRWPEVLPSEYSLRAWEYVISKNSKTHIAILTSFKIAVSCIIANIVIAVPAANALGRYKFKYKSAIEAIILLPVLIPPIIIMGFMYKKFLYLNLADNIYGVILAHILATLPYMIKSVSLSYKNLGFEYEQQGMVLGAGKFLRFTDIVFPQILPGLVVGTTLTFIISLSQYIITAFIGGGKVLTLMTLMYPYINGGSRSIGAAYAVLFAVFTIVIMGILDRYMGYYYSEEKYN